MANSQHIDWLLEGVTAWNARVQAEREKDPQWRADFSESDIRAAFEGSGKIVDETISLQGADLWRADLRGADLRGADLGGADLGEAGLRGASLTGADLTGADLMRANLMRANLGGADLRGADLGGANLWRADLRRADFGMANLGKANLERADVRTANWGADTNDFSTPQFTDLTSVRFMTQSQLDMMTGDSGTILPEGLTLPADWPDWEAAVPTAPPALPDPPPITAIKLTGDRLILAAVSGPDRQDLETIYTDLQEDLSALSASGSFNNISAVFDTAFQRFVRICNVAYEDLDQVRFGVQVSAIRLRLESERGDIEAIALDKVGALDAILLSGDLIIARLPEWQTFLNETAPEEAPVEAHAEEVANILTEAAEAFDHDPAHFDPTLAVRLREYRDTATTKAYLGGINLLTNMAYAVFDNVRIIGRDTLKEGRKLLSQGLAASFTVAVGEKLFTLSSILPNELAWIKPWLVFLGGLMPL